MSQQELLKKVIQVLDLAEIQYMITGSVVSSLQGDPRSAHDINMVIAIEFLHSARHIEILFFFLEEEPLNPKTLGHI